MATEPDELGHLKRVSRIKHQILTRYLPSWAVILGSSHDLLYYVDCFAGPGRYESDGDVVDGSPIIAVKAGKKFAASHSGKKLGMILIDDDDAQLKQLKRFLSSTLPYPDNFKVDTRLADSHELIPKVIEGIKRRRAPSFFLVDPYGHPLSIPVMNDVLALPRSELLINFMWYRINMDMTNAAVQHHVSELFGDEAWKQQPFISQRSTAREKGVLDYFRSRLAAQYVLPFRIRYDAEEDRVLGNRTKYYLIHASNNLKAVLLMKEVMWPLGDEEGTFDFSGKSQGILISQTPRIDELQDILLRLFAGQQLAFDDIRGKTWDLPFIEKHYRSVLQALRSFGRIEITPVTSKSGGLKGRDLVRFPKEPS
ncbi:MAG TPA: three-Cys-motif partner protein TcmP [Verrucomicrobiae bacterium]|nr:three-Cys-motif partner protein TcmP [Verrucomicrobiae bacterium]